MEKKERQLQEADQEHSTASQPDRWGKVKGGTMEIMADLLVLSIKDDLLEDAAREFLTDKLIKAIKEAAKGNTSISEYAKAIQEEIAAKAEHYNAIFEHYSGLKPYIDEELTENPDLYPDVDTEYYLSHIDENGELDNDSVPRLIKAAERRRLDSLPEKARKIAHLLPYLTRAIKKAAKDPEPIETTLYEVVDKGFNTDGTPRANGKYKKIIAWAIETAKENGITPKNPDHGSEQERPPVYKDRVSIFASPNSAVSNLIAGSGRLMLANREETEAPVQYGKNGRPGIIAYVLVSLDGEAAGTNVTWTPKQRLVHDAICSIAEQAFNAGIKNPVFTAQTIYQALPGCGGKMRESIKHEIEDAIDYLISYHTKVDATAEATIKGDLKKGERRIFKANAILATEREDTKRSGQIERVWELADKPLLFRYAEYAGKNQIRSIPKRWLEPCEVKENGEPDPYRAIKINLDRACMLAYMARRLSWQKYEHTKATGRARKLTANGKNSEDQERQQLSNMQPRFETVLFETLFEESGMIHRDKISVKRDRDFCIDVLKYWKAAGIIRDYSINADKDDRRKIRSYTVKLCT